MNIFRENYCRVCVKFFCCKTCRLEHEEESHGIHPECDICIYGRTHLRTSSESLLLHICRVHWPLHCVLCKKVFTSTKELTLHSLCPITRKHNLENSSALIESSSTEQNYDSPPITTMMHKSILTSSNKHIGAQDSRFFLTSTPMQKNNENQLLEQIPEVITPVDYSGKMDTFEHIKSSEAIKSSIKSDRNVEPSLKRRVTFSEIDVINNYEESNDNDLSCSEDQNRCDVKEEEVIDLNNTETSEMYITATEDISKTSSLYITVSEEPVQQNCDVPEPEGCITVMEELDTNENGSSEELQTSEEDPSITFWGSALDSKVISEISISKDLDELCSNSLIKDSGVTDFESTSSITSQISNNSCSQMCEERWTSISDGTKDKLEIVEGSSSSTLQLNIKLNSHYSNEIEQGLSPVVKINSKRGYSLEGLQTLHLDTKDIPDEIHNSTNIEEGLPSVEDFSVIKETPNLTFGQDFVKLNNSISDSVELMEKTSSDQDKKTLNQNKYLPKFKISLLENLSLKINRPAASSTHSGESTSMAHSSQGVPSHDNITKSGIWSSVTNVFKNVVSGLSRSSVGRKKRKKEDIKQNEPQKRTKSESDISEESPIKKKMKLTHIQCRRTIRNIRPFQELGYGRMKIKVCDKNTQTDF